MGYNGQQLFKNSPWAALIMWIVFIAVIAFPMLEGENIWIILGGCAIAIALIVLIFFVCRRQARINKKLKKQGKSINNVSWTKNMGLHMDEILDEQNNNDANDAKDSQ